MFIIRNIGPNDLVLDDLRVVLGPGKEIDLDKTVSRVISENSEKLRLELTRKIPRVKIVLRDPSFLPDMGGQHIPEKSVLERMERRMVERIGQKDAQIAALTEAVKSLVVKLGEQKPIVVREVMQSHQQTELNAGSVDSSSDGMSDDMHSRIHAKAVERMSKGLKANIEQEPVKYKDESLAKDLDELENLGL